MLQKIVKCRIILPDGYNLLGDLKIGDTTTFQKWLSKNVEYDHTQDINEIIFEMMRVNEVKNGRKREEF